tara:strand:- start:400 stop:657 length:258 start_codon:yes stop_codon:yes gene_type:complete
MSNDKKYIIKVNGVEREMTPDEKQIKDELLADVETQRVEEQAHKEERNSCRASAKDKLVALGLTSKEVDCVMWGDFPKEVKETEE